MKECISVPVGQRGSAYKSQVVQANGFLFLSAQRGVDPATNQVTFQDTASQSRRILDNLTDVMAALGGSLNDVIKTGRYLKDLTHWRVTNAVWAEYFGRDDLPAQFTVKVADIFGPENPSNILVDTIALVPGGPPKELIPWPYGQSEGEFASHIVKANGFLFFPAQRGVPPTANGVRYLDASGQVRQILENLTAVLESLGGSLDDVVKTSLFVKDIRDRPAINEVWTEFFGHENPPTRCAVQMVDVSGLDDQSRIMVDVIALAPGGEGRKECIRSQLPPRFGPFVSQAVKANGFLFFAAQRGVEAETNKVQIADTGSQARQVLENMAALLESLGGSLDDVVKSGLFMKNIRDRPAINEAWSSYFGETPPSRFGVQVADIFGGTDLTNLLVDAIAVLPGEPKTT